MLTLHAKKDTSSSELGNDGPKMKDFVSDVKPMYVTCGHLHFPANTAADVACNQEIWVDISGLEIFNHHAYWLKRIMEEELVKHQRS